MRKARTIAIALTSLAALAWLSSPREPRFEGKPLSEWMEGIGYGQVIDGRRQLDDDIGWIMPFRETLPAGRDSHEIDRSHRALRQIGTNAIPFLKPMLLAGDSALRERVDSWIQQFPRLAKHFPTPRQERQHAMAALHCLGETAVPVLLQVFEDEQAPPDVRTFAAYTFLGYPRRSSSALAGLKRAQNSTDILLAYIAAEALKSVESGTTDSERLEDRTD